MASLAGQHGGGGFRDSPARAAEAKRPSPALPIMRAAAPARTPSPTGAVLEVPVVAQHHSRHARGGDQRLGGPVLGGELRAAIDPPSARWCRRVVHIGVSRRVDRRLVLRHPPAQLAGGDEQHLVCSGKGSRSVSGGRSRLGVRGHLSGEIRGFVGVPAGRDDVGRGHRDQQGFDTSRPSWPVAPVTTIMGGSALEESDYPTLT